jgi:hypothetical protein
MFTVDESPRAQQSTNDRMVTLRVATAVSVVCISDAVLPLFPSTWDMQQSTMVMPCNYSGTMDMRGSVGKFGIVDFDWSNMKKVWANAHPMNPEELLIDQAKQRKAAICPDTCPYPAGCPDKAACPQAKTWVYRNLVKAFSWFTSVREKLEDPAYAGFFLKFNPTNSTPYHVPQCDTNFSPPKCSDLYHDPEKTLEYGRECTEACDCGKVPCGKYMFDHRNGSMLTKWLLEEYMGSDLTGLRNPNIDGFFLDDIWKESGPSESGEFAVEDMGLSSDDMLAIDKGWRANADAVKAAILNSSGFSWKMFDVGNRTNAGPPFKKEKCTAYMRETACRPDSVLQKQSLFYGFTDQSMNRSELPYFKQDLASFLLIRGPYAWLGYSWVGCNGEGAQAQRNPIGYQFPAELGEDYGEPVDATCSETADGSEVFTRKWSKATVTLDCKSWTSTIDRTNT